MFKLWLELFFGVNILPLFNLISKNNIKIKMLNIETGRSIPIFCLPFLSSAKISPTHLALLSLSLTHHLHRLKNLLTTVKVNDMLYILIIIIYFWKRLQESFLKVH